jgi:gamma-glutamylcyclotransferase (GGCT)/AIG2-like uncharacterized protein YtfP
MSEEASSSRAQCGGQRFAAAEEPKHLFVYGTLMRASRSPYARLLQARARFVGEAWTRGRLYNLGRFPGAVFDAACAGKIHGEIFLVRNPSLLAALDAYEGCGGVGTKPDLFYRDVVEAQLALGGALPCWVYPYAGGVAGRPCIASGRFPL